jgi:hypothetical protein
VSSELLDKTVKRWEEMRHVSDVDYEKFAWLHAACEGQVVPERTVVNSTKTDPASGDPIPRYEEWLRCNEHNVVSAPIVVEGL